MYILMSLLFLVSCQASLSTPDTPSSSASTAYREVLIAGAEEKGYKDGSAMDARFGSIADIAFDQRGNLYIADAANQVIRKLDTNGQVTTIAGANYNLEQYPTGQFKDGPSLEAKFFDPISLTLTNNGTIFVSDYGNNRIRKIHDGKVSTLIGMSVDNYSPGTVLSTNPIRKDGLFDTATIFRPESIRVKSDNIVYLVEKYNVLRVIDTDTRKIQYLKDSFPDVTSLVFGKNNDFWTTNISGSYLVFRYNLESGDFIEKVGTTEGLPCDGFTGYCWSDGLQDGQFEKAHFKNADGLALNKNKDVMFVLDHLGSSKAIRQLDLNTRVVKTLGLFKDVDRIFISDQNDFFLVKHNNALYRLDPSPAKGVQP